MEKTTIFENLKCWQSSKKLLMSVHSVSHTGRLSSQFFLKNHLRRRSIQAMSLIAHGIHKSNMEFVLSLQDSNRSIAELKCMLALLADQNLLATERMHEVVHQIASETESHTIELIAWLQNSNR
jgi:four helix bundle protein